MRTSEFKDWLRELPMNPRPLKDCVSRCKKVEKALNVDLDEEYSKDYGKTVLESLKYSPADERDHIEAPKSFGFKPGANIRFRFTDLRSAINKYFSFCKSDAGEHDA